MLQTLDGKLVYVVEFDTMPELPIIGLTEEEAAVERMYSLARGIQPGFFDPKARTTGTYAEALDAAIREGVITEPGKYGIHIYYDKNSVCHWEAHKIIE